MDYTSILSELNQATTFDLYRIYTAIGHEMERPERIAAIKAALHIGMKLSYFDYAENRLLEATLLEMRRKTVVVLDHEKKKRFIVVYYVLNVENVNVDIHSTHPKGVLSANHLRVGDRVGFRDRDGHPVVGIVQRLNSKTATVLTSQHKWRVPYAYLHRVHDGEMASEAYLDAPTDGS